MSPTANCQCSSVILSEVRSAAESRNSPLIHLAYEKVRGIPDHRLVAQCCLRLQAANTLSSKFSPIPLRLFWRGGDFVHALTETMTSTRDWGVFRAGLWEMTMFPPSPTIAKELPSLFSTLIQIADRESLSFGLFASLARAHRQYIPENDAIDLWEALEFPPGLLPPHRAREMLAVSGQSRDRLHSIALDVLLSCGMVEEPLSVLSCLQSAPHSALVRDAAIALGGGIYPKKGWANWEAFLSGCVSADELPASRELLQQAINSLPKYPRAIQYIVVHFPHEISFALDEVLKRNPKPELVQPLGMSLAMFGGVRTRPWVRQQYQFAAQRSRLFKIAREAMRTYPPNSKDLKLALQRGDGEVIAHHASAATPSIAEQAPIDGLVKILANNSRESVWLAALRREEDIRLIAQFLAENPLSPHYVLLSQKAKKAAREAIKSQCSGDLRILACLALSSDPRDFIQSLPDSSHGTREKILNLFRVRFGSTYHSPQGCWLIDASQTL